MLHVRRQGAAAALLGSVLLLALVVVSSSGAASRAALDRGADQSDAVHYDTSPPLTAMTPAPAPDPDTHRSATSTRCVDLEGFPVRGPQLEPC